MVGLEENSTPSRQRSPDDTYDVRRMSAPNASRSSVRVVQSTPGIDWEFQITVIEYGFSPFYPDSRGIFTAFRPTPSRASQHDLIQELGRD